MSTPTTHTTRTARTVRAQTPRTDRRGQRTMGVSRDFTSGATALDERPARSTVPARGRTRVLHQPQTPERRSPQRRLGSRQVVSVRGRRVATTRRTTLLAKLGAAAIVLLILGVAVAMWLSGVSTQQTFRIQQLVSQEQQLSNQLETLNRDLENIRSSAEIARRAGEMGMALPLQPGILEVRENGEIVEERVADPATRPILDLNGQPIRPGQASSDPRATDELTDSLESLPEGHQLPVPSAPVPGPGAGGETALAPYVPNVPAVDTQAGEDGQ